MELKEMLELAALAAGEVHLVPYRQEWVESEDAWRPHTDDGDSFRLAVALKLSVCVCDEAVIVEQCMGSFQSLEKLGLDPCKATRLAVLRCAAEAGKSIRAEGGAA